MSRRAPSARTGSTSSSQSPAVSAKPYAWHTRRAHSTWASCSAAWSSRVSVSLRPRRSQASAPTSILTATSCLRRIRGRAWSSARESSGPPTNQDSVSGKKYLILAEEFSHDPHYAKTARGVMRYRRGSVVAMLDSKQGVELRDLREPPADLSTATGENLEVDATIVLTVGSDCAIGKMTATCELDLEARRRGLKSVFVPTGQTGIAIAGWGISVDAVVSDFLAGAAERLVIEGAKKGDLLWVEGQGAILHPVDSGVTVGVIHGSAPHAYVLCHEVGRTHVEGDATHSPLPSLAELVDLHERMSLKLRPAKVACIALNTAFVSEDEARE